MQNITYTKGLHPDTIVLLGDGGYKTVKYIQVGDYIVCDDSAARKVSAINTGVDNMYRVIPKKGDPFICSAGFMLTMKGIMPRIAFTAGNTHNKFTVYYTQQGRGKTNSFNTEEKANIFLNTLPKEDIFDISAIDYCAQNKTFKHCTYLFHQGINFVSSDVPFDPYIIGYWLGDGTSRDTTLTTADPKVVDYLNNKLPEYGLQLTKLQDKYGYNICSAGDNYRIQGKNSFLNVLKDLNMLNNKHIPDVYILNSFEVRLRILAGLIDSDGNLSNGNNIEISQKSDKLSDDIEYLAFSLGFMFTKKKGIKSCVYEGETSEGFYTRMKIFGENVKYIPTILDRKVCTERLINKRATCQGFDVEWIGTGQYCGFQIEGNGRFLKDDFTVLSTK